MFTGIIQHRAQVIEIAQVETGARLVIDASGWSHSPSQGDSIAVNGCCLTVALSRSQTPSLLTFDIVHQTLRNTTLGALREGHVVNIEHAATPTTLLDGHIVQGHVDGVGAVISNEAMNVRSNEADKSYPRSVTSSRQSEHRLCITPPIQLMEFIADRGSIAVDGVSLTVASVQDASFEVALIPTTLAMTTLVTLREGDRVNLEVDYLAKIVVQWLKRQI